MRPRRGFGLALGLLALVIFAATLAALLSQIAAGRGVVRLSESRRQATWLAISGLERASVRLLDDPDYSGETWSIPADQLDGHATGTVAIGVESGTEQSASGSRKITATARLTSGNRPGITRKASTTLNLEIER